MCKIFTGTDSHYVKLVKHSLKDLYRHNVCNCKHIKYFIQNCVLHIKFRMSYLQ